MTINLWDVLFWIWVLSVSVTLSTLEGNLKIIIHNQSIIVKNQTILLESEKR